eukprot:CAMPEP_0168456420 /NCGR_PEP_ID=MMETSP0228-20121227/51283_1 /TAXON_ID=133427 /ORGANISM="Protoceratium reticulatum, Strain CCCM 535 (=CCMP 1889)" /LENGTH=50 /DNA_ID=CAMNT_0008471349 /DNA_START=81 /DNA_END=230 /DNA_ORIENTATION=-
MAACAELHVQGQVRMLQQLDGLAAMAAERQRHLLLAAVIGGLAEHHELIP